MNLRGQVKIQLEKLEAERNEENKRQQAILLKETVLVKNELEELMFKADERKFVEELQKGAKAEQEEKRLAEERAAEFEAQQQAALEAQRKE